MCRIICFARRFPEHSQDKPGEKRMRGNTNDRIERLHNKDIRIKLAVPSEPVAVGNSRITHRKPGIPRIRDQDIYRMIADQYPPEGIMNRSGSSP